MSETEDEIDPATGRKREKKPPAQPKNLLEMILEMVMSMFGGMFDFLGDMFGMKKTSAPNPQPAPGNGVGGDGKPLPGVGLDGKPLPAGGAERAGDPPAPKPNPLPPPAPPPVVLKLDPNKAPKVNPPGGEGPAGGPLNPNQPVPVVPQAPVVLNLPPDDNGKGKPVGGGDGKVEAGGPPAATPNDKTFWDKAIGWSVFIIPPGLFALSGAIGLTGRMRGNGTSLFGVMDRTGNTRFGINRPGFLNPVYPVAQALRIGLVNAPVALANRAASVFNLIPGVDIPRLPYLDSNFSRAVDWSRLSTTPQNIRAWVPGFVERVGAVGPWATNPTGFIVEGDVLSVQTRDGKIELARRMQGVSGDWQLTEVGQKLWEGTSAPATEATAALEKLTQEKEKLEAAQKAQTTLQETGLQTDALKKSAAERVEAAEKAVKAATEEFRVANIVPLVEEKMPGGVKKFQNEVKRNGGKVRVYVPPPPSGAGASPPGGPTPPPGLAPGAIPQPIPPLAVDALAAGRAPTGVATPAGGPAATTPLNAESAVNLARVRSLANGTPADKALLTRAGFTDEQVKKLGACTTDAEASAIISKASTDRTLNPTEYQKLFTPDNRTQYREYFRLAELRKLATKNPDRLREFGATQAEIDVLKIPGNGQPDPLATEEALLATKAKIENLAHMADKLVDLQVALDTRVSGSVGSGDNSPLTPVTPSAPALTAAEQAKVEAVRNLAKNTPDQLRTLKQADGTRAFTEADITALQDDTKPPQEHQRVMREAAGKLTMPEVIKLETAMNSPSAKPAPLTAGANPTLPGAEGETARTGFGRRGGTPGDRPGDTRRNRTPNKTEWIYGVEIDPETGQPVRRPRGGASTARPSATSVANPPALTPFPEDTKLLPTERTKLDTLRQLAHTAPDRLAAAKFTPDEIAALKKAASYADLKQTLTTSSHDPMAFDALVTPANSAPAGRNGPAATGNTGPSGAARPGPAGAGNFFVEGNELKLRTTPNSAGTEVIEIVMTKGPDGKWALTPKGSELLNGPIANDLRKAAKEQLQAVDPAANSERTKAEIERINELHSRADTPEKRAAADDAALKLSEKLRDARAQAEVLTQFQNAKPAPLPGSGPLPELPKTEGGPRFGFKPDEVTVQGKNRTTDATEHRTIMRRNANGQWQWTAEGEALCRAHPELKDALDKTVDKAVEEAKSQQKKLIDELRKYNEACNKAKADENAATGTAKEAAKQARLQAEQVRDAYAQQHKTELENLRAIIERKPSSAALAAPPPPPTAAELALIQEIQLAENRLARLKTLAKSNPNLLKSLGVTDNDLKMLLDTRETPTIREHQLQRTQGLCYSDSSSGRKNGLAQVLDNPKTQFVFEERTVSILGEKGGALELRPVLEKGPDGKWGFTEEGTRLLNNDAARKQLIKATKAHLDGLRGTVTPEAIAEANLAYERAVYRSSVEIPDLVNRPGADMNEVTRLAGEARQEMRRAIAEQQRLIEARREIQRLEALNDAAQAKNATVAVADAVVAANLARDIFVGENADAVARAIAENPTKFPGLKGDKLGKISTPALTPEHATEKMRIIREVAATATPEELVTLVQEQSAKMAREAYVVEHAEALTRGIQVSPETFPGAKTLTPGELKLLTEPPKVETQAERIAALKKATGATSNAELEAAVKKHTVEAGAKSQAKIGVGLNAYMFLTSGDGLLKAVKAGDTEAIIVNSVGGGLAATGFVVDSAKALGYTTKLDAAAGKIAPPVMVLMSAYGLQHEWRKESGTRSHVAEVESGAMIWAGGAMIYSSAVGSSGFFAPITATALAFGGAGYGVGGWGEEKLGLDDMSTGWGRAFGASRKATSDLAGGLSQKSAKSDLDVMLARGNMPRMQLSSDNLRITDILIPTGAQYPLTREVLASSMSPLALTTLLEDNTKTRAKVAELHAAKLKELEEAKADVARLIKITPISVDDMLLKRKRGQQLLNLDAWNIVTGVNMLPGESLPTADKIAALCERYDRVEADLIRLQKSEVELGVRETVKVGQRQVGKEWEDVHVGFGMDSNLGTAQEKKFRLTEREENQRRMEKDPDLADYMQDLKRIALIRDPAAYNAALTQATTLQMMRQEEKLMAIADEFKRSNLHSRLANTLGEAGKHISNDELKRAQEVSKAYADHIKVGGTAKTFTVDAGALATWKAVVSKVDASLGAELEVAAKSFKETKKGTSPKPNAASITTLDTSMTVLKLSNDDAAKAKVKAIYDAARSAPPVPGGPLSPDQFLLANAKKAKDYNLPDGIIDQMLITPTNVDGMVLAVRVQNEVKLGTGLIPIPQVVPLPIKEGSLRFVRDNDGNPVYKKINVRQAGITIPVGQEYALNEALSELAAKKGVSTVRYQDAQKGNKVDPDQEEIVLDALPGKRERDAKAAADKKKEEAEKSSPEALMRQIEEIRAKANPLSGFTEAKAAEKLRKQLGVPDPAAELLKRMKENPDVFHAATDSVTNAQAEYQKMKRLLIANKIPFRESADGKTLVVKKKALRDVKIPDGKTEVQQIKDEGPAFTREKDGTYKLTESGLASLTDKAGFNGWQLQGAPTWSKEGGMITLRESTPGPCVGREMVLHLTPQADGTLSVNLIESRRQPELAGGLVAGIYTTPKTALTLDLTRKDGADAVFDAVRANATALKTKVDAVNTALNGHYNLDQLIPDAYAPLQGDTVRRGTDLLTTLPPEVQADYQRRRALYAELEYLKEVKGEVYDKDKDGKPLQKDGKEYRTTKTERLLEIHTELFGDPKKKDDKGLVGRLDAYAKSHEAENPMWFKFKLLISAISARNAYEDPKDPDPDKRLSGYRTLDEAGKALLYTMQNAQAKHDLVVRTKATIASMEAVSGKGNVPLASLGLNEEQLKMLFTQPGQKFGDTFDGQGFGATRLMMHNGKLYVQEAHFYPEANKKGEDGEEVVVDGKKIVIPSHTGYKFTEIVSVTAEGYPVINGQPVWAEDGKQLEEGKFVNGKFEKVKVFATRVNYELPGFDARAAGLNTDRLVAEQKFYTHAAKLIPMDKVTANELEMQHKKHEEALVPLKTALGERSPAYVAASTFVHSRIENQKLGLKEDHGSTRPTDALVARLAIEQDPAKRAAILTAVINMNDVSADAGQRPVFGDTPYQQFKLLEALTQDERRILLATKTFDSITDQAKAERTDYLIRLASRTEGKSTGFYDYQKQMDELMKLDVAKRNEQLRKNALENKKYTDRGHAPPLIDQDNVEGLVKTRGLKRPDEFYAGNARQGAVNKMLAKYHEYIRNNPMNDNKLNVPTREFVNQDHTVVKEQMVLIQAAREAEEKRIESDPNDSKLSKEAKADKVRLAGLKVQGPVSVTEESLLVMRDVYAKLKQQEGKTVGGVKIDAAYIAELEYFAHTYLDVDLKQPPTARGEMAKRPGVLLVPTDPAKAFENLTDVRTVSDMAEVYVATALREGRTTFAFDLNGDKVLSQREEILLREVNKQLQVKLAEMKSELDLAEKAEKGGSVPLSEAMNKRLTAQMKEVAETKKAIDEAKAKGQDTTALQEILKREEKAVALTAAGKRPPEELAEMRVAHKNGEENLADLHKQARDRHYVTLDTKVTETKTAAVVDKPEGHSLVDTAMALILRGAGVKTDGLDPVPTLPGYTPTAKGGPAPIGPAK